jgi:Transposase DDE domain
MFTDEQRSKVWGEIRQHDFRAFARLLPDSLFTDAAQRCGLRITRCALNVVSMVWLGLISAVHPLHSFAALLTLTVKLLDDSEHGMPGTLTAARKRARRKRKRRSKHDPHGTDPLQVTEEAFVKARKALPLAFWTTLLTLLSERFEQRHAQWIRWNHFRLLALDGTHVKLPNWKPLAGYFGRASNGRSRGPVRARMVMLQMPLARLPWRYSLVPQKQGETTVAADLLRELRADDLVLMDQGFWSYRLFHMIQEQNAFFAIRLRSQAKFKRVKRLGTKDHLVEFRRPNRCGRRGTLPDTLRLRVVNYQIPGYRPSAVVTNVLNPRVVSRTSWIRLSTQTTEGSQRLDVGLYHRRWEIETTFRELKVTQGMEGTLRSRTPEGVAYEVAGHVLLYLLVRWLMVEAAEKAGTDPLRLSFRGALRELLDMAPLLVTSSLKHVTQVLLPRLLERIAGHPVPFRPGRHYARPHDTEVRNLGNGRYRLPHKLAKKAA